MGRLISRRVRRSGDQAFGAGEPSGDDHGTPEEVRIKRARHALLPLKPGDKAAQGASERHQDRKRRRSLRGPEAVENTAQNSRLGLSVDVWIMAIQVAQAGLEAIFLGFEDEELMHLLAAQGIGDTELERHVEPGHSKRAGGPLG